MKSTSVTEPYAPNRERRLPILGRRQTVGSAERGSYDSAPYGSCNATMGDLYADMLSANIFDRKIPGSHDALRVLSGANRTHQTFGELLRKRRLLRCYVFFLRAIRAQIRKRDQRLEKSGSRVSIL